MTWMHISLNFISLAIVFGPRMNAQLYRSAVRSTGTQSTGDAGVMDSDMAQKAELVRKTNQTDWLSADYSAIAQTAANLEIRGSGVSVSSGQAVESSLDCIVSIHYNAESTHCQE